MQFGANGDKIRDAMAKAMAPKLNHVDSKQHLENISVEMKKNINLWYVIMRTMKPVEFQDDEACLKFKKK